MMFFKFSKTRFRRRTKGQSVIVQFILFFLIGITLYIGLGNLFRIQSEVVRSDLIGLYLDMIESYVSSVTVSSVEGCTDCDIVENKIKLDKTYASYFIEVGINDSGIFAETAPKQYGQLSSINNLNQSLNIIEGSAPSIETINLTFDKTQNKLEIR